MEDYESDDELPWFQQTVLVDPTLSFEMFPNGHRSFLTKAAKHKLRGAGITSVEGFNLDGGMAGGLGEDIYWHVDENDRPSKRKRGRKKRDLSEPLSEFWGGEGGWNMAGNTMVTLRLRALKGHKLPELVEGDTLVGVKKRRKVRRAEDDGDDTPNSSEDEPEDPEDVDDDEKSTRCPLYPWIDCWIMFEKSTRCLPYPWTFTYPH